MSRVPLREWYTRVNHEWPHEDYPDGLPALTFEEAARAFRKLYRFALGKTWKGDIRETTGNRHTWVRRRVAHLNSGKGWHSFVHSLSHLFCYLDDPNGKPHSSTHARMEIRLIKEVVRRGWLSGKLKSEPKPEPAEKPKPDKMARLLERELQWQRKVQRAERALAKGAPTDPRRRVSTQARSSGASSGGAT